MSNIAHRLERALAAFFFDDEKSIDSQPVQQGDNPGLVSGDLPITSESTHLFNNPCTSSIDGGGVRAMGFQ